jgi:hypothetical protein
MSVKMEKAIQDGSIKRFSMLEGPAGGDQDLNIWTLEFEDVVRETMENLGFKGNQNSRSRWTWMRLERGCLAARQMPEWHFR